MQDHPTRPANRTCIVCGKAFYRSPAQLAKGAGNYCSRTCQAARMKEERRQPETHVDCVCERCGKTFSVHRSSLAQADRTGRGRFCSWACRRAPKDEVVKRVDRMGYVAMRIDGKWTHEHRVVAEQMVGHPLPKGTAIHHLDGDKTNNDPSNLRIMTRSDHQRMHHKERFVLDVGQWGPGRESCVECRTTDLPHKGHGLCIYCYRRRRTVQEKPDAAARGSYRLLGR